jgi:DNA-binding transcriptional regulator YiaG
VTTLLEPRTGALAAVVGLTCLVSSGTSLPITRDIERLVPGTGVWAAQSPATATWPMTLLAQTMTSDSANFAPRQLQSTTRNLVVELKERADITWEQLAKALGVSRRAVHHWASGGRMASGNEESVMRLMGAVDAIHAAESDDSTRRRAVLAAVDAMRTSRAAADDDVNRPAITFEATSPASR